MKKYLNSLATSPQPSSSPRGSRPVSPRSTEQTFDSDEDLMHEETIITHHTEEGSAVHAYFMELEDVRDNMNIEGLIFFKQLIKIILRFDLSYFQVS